MLAALRVAPRGAWTALPRPRREASAEKRGFSAALKREGSTTMRKIDLSGACSAPTTEEVWGRSGRLGPLDMLVYRKGKRWCWLVHLDGHVLVEGRARGEEAAMHAAEAAAFRSFPAAVPSHHC